MNTVTRGRRPWRVVALLTLLVATLPAWAGDPDPLTGSVDLGGSVTGTGTGDRDHAKDYNGKYTFSAVYSIATKTDANGKKEFDYTKSKVLFNDPDLGFTTKSVPITHIDGDPATGQVKSFNFEGVDWYPDDGSGAIGTKLKGAVTINAKNPKQGTATLTASYKDQQGKTVSNYSFTSGSPKKPGPPKKGPNGRPFATDTRISETESLDYHADTGILSIHDDFIVGTPDAIDPLLGAQVTLPDFVFTGFTVKGDLAVFWPVDEAPYLLGLNGDIYASSHIPFLYFNTADATFHAALSPIGLAGTDPNSPFHDPALTAISSPYLAGIAALLDPSSPTFDPLASLYLTITPDTNFLLLTDYFTKSGKTGASDQEFVARSVPDAEPATALLLAAACTLGIVLRSRCRRGVV